MAGFTQPFRLRSRSKVTWLELFFDLIFVAAVAQVAEPLREHYDVSGALRFAALFALIWSAWVGYTTFATRFESEGLLQRVLTIVQVFVVAAMAANAGDSLDSRESAGFAAAYAVLRLLLVGQYLRARRLPDAHGLTTRTVAGHGCAAALWLASSVLPIPWRFWLWALALVIDVATPWTVIAHTVRLPPTPSHLPERFGLFTLILIGEAVVAIMHGMKSQENWPASAAISAFLGMALLFVVWWWYFDAVDAVADQHVRSRRDAIRVQIWSHAHFPLYLGIVITGVGVQRLISAASRFGLTPQEVWLPIVSAAVMAAAMAVIASTTRRGSQLIRTALPRALGVLLVLSVTLVGLRLSSPVTLVAALTLSIAIQAFLSAGSNQLHSAATE